MYKSINLKDEDYVVMTEDVNDSDSIIMVTQRGAMKRIDFNVLQEAKRAQRGITLLKEKRKPHRIVAGEVKENHTNILYSLNIMKNMVISMMYTYLNNILMDHLLLILMILEK